MSVTVVIVIRKFIYITDKANMLINTGYFIKDFKLMVTLNFNKIRNNHNNYNKWKDESNDMFKHV